MGNGKYYAVNVPFIQGIDDESYLHVFRQVRPVRLCMARVDHGAALTKCDGMSDLLKQVLRRVMERYKPDAIVVGVSPGGLAGDRYGIFNLTLDGAVPSQAGCVVATAANGWLRPAIWFALRFFNRFDGRRALPPKVQSADATAGRWLVVLGQCVAVMDLRHGASATYRSA